MSLPVLAVSKHQCKWINCTIRRIRYCFSGFFSIWKQNCGTPADREVQGGALHQVRANGLPEGTSLWPFTLISSIPGVSEQKIRLGKPGDSLVRLPSWCQWRRFAHSQSRKGRVVWYRYSTVFYRVLELLEPPCAEVFLVPVEPQPGAEIFRKLEPGPKNPSSAPAPAVRSKF